MARPDKGAHTISIALTRHLTGPPNIYTPKEAQERGAFNGNEREALRPLLWPQIISKEIYVLVLCFSADFTRDFDKTFLERPNIWD